MCGLGCLNGLCFATDCLFWLLYLFGFGVGFVFVGIAFVCLFDVVVVWFIAGCLKRLFGFCGGFVCYGCLID